MAVFVVSSRIQSAGEPWPEPKAPTRVDVLDRQVAPPSWMTGIENSLVHGRLHATNRCDLDETNGFYTAFVSQDTRHRSYEVHMPVSVGKMDGVTLSRCKLLGRRTTDTGMDAHGVRASGKHDVMVSLSPHFECFLVFHGKALQPLQGFDSVPLASTDSSICPSLLKNTSGRLARRVWPGRKATSPGQCLAFATKRASTGLHAV
jgi:hypothetical protein